MNRVQSHPPWSLLLPPGWRAMNGGSALSISDAVPELVEQALRNGGPKSDNVTILAVEWEAAEDTDVAGAVSTQTLGDEVFASTIQASVMGQDVPDELDDAEIERSIKEINEAIRRSSQKKS